jgi:hypothetical protein
VVRLSVPSARDREIGVYEQVYEYDGRGSKTAYSYTCSYTRISSDVNGAVSEGRAGSCLCHATGDQ